MPGRRYHSVFLLQGRGLANPAIQYVLEETRMTSILLSNKLRLGSLVNVEMRRIDKRQWFTYYSPIG